MKYSVLMPYYERFDQFHRTLISFDHHYAGRDDYQIIVAIDDKNADDVLDLSADHEHLNLGYTWQLPHEQPTYNPVLLYNQAANCAQGKYLIITSPECLHRDDVLSALDVEFAACPEAYVICACESAKQVTMEGDNFENLRYVHHQWYQHSKHRNARYHFCTALPRETFARIGGFDPAYADGVGYDDDDFRDRVLATNIPVIIRDDVVVLHQEHLRTHQLIDGSDYRERLNRNKNLYESRRARAT